MPHEGGRKRRVVVHVGGRKRRADERGSSHRAARKNARRRACEHCGSPKAATGRHCGRDNAGKHAPPAGCVETMPSARTVAREYHTRTLFRVSKVDRQPERRNETQALALIGSSSLQIKATKGSSCIPTNASQQSIRSRPNQ